MIFDICDDFCIFFYRQFDLEWIVLFYGLSVFVVFNKGCWIVLSNRSDWIELTD